MGELPHHFDIAEQIEIVSHNYQIDLIYIIYLLIKINFYQKYYNYEILKNYEVYFVVFPFI